MTDQSVYHYLNLQLRKLFRFECDNENILTEDLVYSLSSNNSIDAISLPSQDII